MATSGLVKTALEKKRLAGERTGKVPFGYNLAADGKTLVANAEEQHTLGLIRQLRAEGETLQAIANYLSSQGIQTKGGNVTWSHSTIQRIINREVKR